MNISNEQLSVWANAPSATKYIVTRNRIEKAITAKFGSKVDVYLQGSYKNSTNIRTESDVDIVVEYKPAYYPGFFQVSEEDKARYYRETHIRHEYSFAEFKNDVFDILNDEFSKPEVKRGNKSIKVLKNENRVNADVITCFTHKRFINYKTYDQNAIGIHFFTDEGHQVINFPKQHFQNGEEKNLSNRTNGKYKDMVRILKNIRYELVDAGELVDKEIPSHFIECLVWNVSDHHFLKNNYINTLKTVTAVIWTDMDTAKDPYNNYRYIHDLQWLFKANPEYTPELASKFISKVWSFAGF